MTDNIYRRCCVCKAVQIGKDYFPKEIMRMRDVEGEPSDTIFSRECTINFYGVEFFKDIKDFEFELDKCPSLEDFKK